MIMRSKLVTIALSLIGGWMVLLVVSAQIRHSDQATQVQALDDRISGAERENTRLSQELERMHQPAWLVLLARARLNYVRPDETVVFVYKSQKSDIVGQPQRAQDSRTRWSKWWDWLQGR